jgi:hypothetical protein
LAAGVSQAVAGWLILLAAFATAGLGLVLRAVLGRRPDARTLRRVYRRFRGTRIARLVFGPVPDADLDPDDLDQVILMPSIVVACGLFLVALFLLGYETIT